jgi:hypothetical protein
MADLARLDQVGERAERLLDRHAVLLRRVHIAEPAEAVDQPVGRMGLVDIDVVGLQALERAVERGNDVGPVEPSPAVAHMRHGVVHAGHLGRQHDLPAHLRPLLQPGADAGLAAAEGLRLRRHGIHLRHVDEIDAELHGAVELGMGLGLAVLLAPGHGAETNQADIETAGPEGAILHGLISGE